MIDAHVHIFPRYRSRKAVRWIKKYIPWLDVEDSVDETMIVNRLERCGISSFINYIYPLHSEESEPLNEFNHRLSKRVRNAACFGSVHPDNENREGIVKRAILDLGLVGLKFHPFVQRFDILDRRMDSVYRTMEILERPVVFHTGFQRFYGAELGVDEMETLLKRHPRLVVVICHMFYPRIADAFRLLKDYPNVYLDGTNVFSDYRESVDGENLFEGLLVRESENAAYRVFYSHSVEDIEQYSHRIMVGSDYPVSMNNPEAIYDHVLKLEIAAEAMRNISHDTARAFIERFKHDFFENESAQAANERGELAGSSPRPT